MIVQLLDSDVLLWLASKPRPRLVGKTCIQKRPAGPDDARRWERCRRPQWGDGSGIGGKGEGLCSRCWHEYNLFHGSYMTMQANHAAAKLDATAIQRLTFHEDELPPLGADVPDTFPEDW